MSFNSTIIQKTGFCIDCPTDAPKKPLTAKRCSFHYQIHRKKICYSRANERQKQIMQAQPEKENDKKELDKWFDDIEQAFFLNGAYCHECGAYISKKYARAATAHIIPKSIFKSVATHPNNFLILGAGCGCHHKWDNGGMTEMNVFERAVNRFATFAHLVEEKHKLLHIFTEHLPLHANS